jgi:hypothetical protein
MSEENVYLNELGEPIAVPPSKVDDPASPIRLCEYDEGTQSGCRRTQTMLALEAEYDTFVHPEMKWGVWDEFCRHEGYIYYYKDLIKSQIDSDESRSSNDFADTDFAKHHAVVAEHLGSSFRKNTLENVSNFFRNPPAGFPAFQIETPQFFQCEDIGEDCITIDDLDRTLLNKIQATFVDNLTPLFSNVSGVLYLHNDKIYCTDYFAYGETEFPGLGVLMVPTESEKYKIGNAYFFPFSDLTEEQTTLITSTGLLELELNGEVVFINL